MFPINVFADKSDDTLVAAFSRELTQLDYHYGTKRYHQEIHFPNRNHYATNLSNRDFKIYGESFGIKSFDICRAVINGSR